MTEKTAEILDRNSITISSDRKYWIRKCNREELIHHDLTSTPSLANVIVQPPQNYETKEKYNTYRSNLKILEDNLPRN